VTKKFRYREQEADEMKLGSSLLILALTVGLAALAVTGVRPDVERAVDVTLQDGDAWFV